MGPKWWFFLLLWCGNAHHSATMRYGSASPKNGACPTLTYTVLYTNVVQLLLITSDLTGSSRVGLHWSCKGGAILWLSALRRRRMSRKTSPRCTKRSSTRVWRRRVRRRMKRRERRRSWACVAARPQRGAGPVLKINNHATGGWRTKDILGGPKSLETKKLGSSKGWEDQSAEKTNNWKDKKYITNRWDTKKLNILLKTETTVHCEIIHLWRGNLVCMCSYPC